MPDKRLFVYIRRKFQTEFLKKKQKKLMENKYKVYYVSMSQWQAHTKTLKTIMAHLKSSG
jgi:hypothetical protein